MLSQALSLLSIKARELITAFLSIYILCEDLAIIGIGSGGISNIASVFNFLKLSNVGYEITSLQQGLIESPFAPYANYLFRAWLIISCSYFTRQYIEYTPSSILTRPAITTSFFWALGTDLFEHHKIDTFYTQVIIITLAIILIINMLKKEEPIIRTLHATISCIASPLILIFAPVVILMRDNKENN